MWSIIIWAVIAALRFTLVSRGLTNKLFVKYSFFYSFNLTTLAIEMLSVAVLTQLPHFYKTWYWGVEFLTLFMACGIVLEIMRHVFSPYDGVRRFAGMFGCFTFGITFLISYLYPHLVGPAPITQIAVEVERNIRAVQALFLLGVLGLIGYYRIGIGTNMKGMIVGFGVSIGASLLSLTAWAQSLSVVNQGARLAEQLGYAFPILIWLVTLWSESPEPVPQVAGDLEGDYAKALAQTGGIVGSLRSYLIGAVRS